MKTTRHQNKKIIVKFEETLWRELGSFLLQNEIEQFCFLFCHTSVSDDSIVVFPKEIVVFENDPQVVQQHEYSVRVDRSVVKEAYIRFIESEYTALVNCHSHPFEEDDVWFSGVDDENDIEHSKNFLSGIKKAKADFGKNSEIFYLSMVFGQKTVSARYYKLATKKFKSVDRVTVMGEPIQQINPSNNSKPSSLTKENREILNRQILAFGEVGQAKISDITVSVIGIGGVGSIIVEGLCRLGVRKFVLVDPDKIELSNMNRFQGAEFDDLGKFKIDVCGRNLKKMFPDISLIKLRKSLFDISVINAIKNTDCLIGCLDNMETRYFLNRLSLQFLLPYIDSGVIIRSDGTRVTGLEMKLGIVIPSLTRCFDCSGIKHYDKKQAKEYFLDHETRKNLIRGGYIKNVDEIAAPAVYPLNMSISSFVLFEFLNLFTGYKKVYWNVVMNYLDLNSNNRKCLNTRDDFEPNTGKCLNCEIYKAVGDFEPLSYFMNRNHVLSLPE